MPLGELLSHPGLDSQLLGGLGPVPFHRLVASALGLKQLPPPRDVWARRWAPPAGACSETAALAVLGAAARAKGSEGEAEVLEQLFVLTAGGRPKGLGSRGPVHNPLDLAVEAGLRFTIPLLRTRGYMLEMLDVYSLESLVQRDQLETVSAYLEAGLSPDARGNAGRSILMVAAAFRAEQVLPLLLRWGADVHQRSGFGQWTALMWAAHVGWEDGCALLLEAKARREDRNAEGASALDIASRMGHDSVRRLLEQPAASGDA